MNKIYSPATDTWFHDLLDNGQHHNAPRYWHIFVGTNTRYMVAQPLAHKDDASVGASLRAFINRYHPTRLTSDDESAFTSRATVNLCKANNVFIYIINDKNHTSLGVIDRAIRSIRDINTVRYYPGDSGDEQFKYFTSNRMRDVVNKYNNMFNRSIGCSPNDMFNDVDKEKEFILRCQRIMSARNRIKDFNFKIGDFVRYRLSKKVFDKKRFMYSPESYKVSDKDGNNFIIVSRDGSALTIPRWKLIKSDVSKHPWKQSMDSPNDVITDITDYDPRTGKYTVIVEDDNAGGYKYDTIPVSFVRGRTPTKITKLEKEFFRKHPNLCQP